MQSDRIRASQRLRIEMACWLILFGACLGLMLMLAAGCRGPDAGARVLSTFGVAYTDGHGSTSNAFSGNVDQPYGQDPPFSGSGTADTNFHAWTFSIQPLAGVYDPQARTRESIDAIYSAMIARETAEKAERAKLLPLVEHSPEPVKEPEPEGLPWWKNTALITGYATLAAALIAGAIKGWSMVKSKKEHA